MNMNSGYNSKKSFPIDIKYRSGDIQKPSASVKPQSSLTTKPEMRSSTNNGRSSHSVSRATNKPGDSRSSNNRQGEFPSSPDSTSLRQEKNKMTAATSQGGSQKNYEGRSQLQRDGPMPQAPPPIRSASGLPFHTEEELLRGCSIQAEWDEKFELAGLINASLKLCRLSPSESDRFWDETIHSFTQLYTLCKAKLARQDTAIHARFYDIKDLLKQQHEVQQTIDEIQQRIFAAQKELVAAKKTRENRQEYESIAQDLTKKSSLREIQREVEEETKRKQQAESEVTMAEKRMALKRKQAENVLQVASDFKKILIEPINKVNNNT